jgi:integrase
MHLFKRCGCTTACRHPWWCRFRLHSRQYWISTKTPNHHLAQRIAQSRYTDALEGQSLRRLPPVKLSAAIKQYLTHIAKEHRTANKAERVLQQFLTFTADRRIADITTFVVEKWKRARANDVEQSTVNRELNVVKGLFSRAVTWKMLAASAAAAVKPYRVDDTRIRVLSDTEVNIVLTKAPPEVALLFRTTFECLPRISELLALKREHIGSSWIELRRKGGRVERVDVTPELRRDLLAHCHRSGYIFGEDPSGEPPTQEAMSVRITRIMRSLSLHGVSHHTARHTGITWMLEQGRNPRAIQVLAGWTTLRMLERYGHVRDAERRSAVTGNAEHVQRALQRSTTAPTATPAAPSSAVADEPAVSPCSFQR